MKKKIILIFFTALAVIQLSVPLSMIANKEMILKYGKIYKFKTKPIDPYDAFRGRYVIIGLENSLLIPANSLLAENQTVYALISIDGGGFSRLSGVQPFQPSGTDYVKAVISYLGKPEWDERYPAGSQHVSLDLPFDRYYIDEEKALDAENAYREHSRGTNISVYAEVRILKGDAVLEELYIDDLPVMEYLSNMLANTNE